MSTADHESRTVVELLMEVVAPVVGGIAVAIALKAWFSLPTWVCLLIALPVGTILGWALLLGLLVTVGALGNVLRRERGEPSDEPKSRSRRF